MATGAEPTYQTNASALQMANAIFGSGVTVTGASYSGPPASSAIYSNGQLAPGVVPSNTGVILSTENVTNFTQSSGDPNRATGTSTNTTGANNGSQFNAVAGTSTYDAVWLNADFIPTSNVMTMSFVFASEEYPEYINSNYNDVVGVWVNGTHVPIIVGNGNISVNNINGTTQENLFVSNTNDAYNTEMGGFTLTLTLNMAVIPGVVNSIRIGIADAADANYDSNLLIAGDPVQTVLVAGDDVANIFNDGNPHVIDILSNDIHLSGSTLTITQINEMNVVAGQSVTLPSGQVIKQNADGTITVTPDGHAETKVFTYTVKDNQGHTDTGFVTINSIPCFVVGTLIQTPSGEIRVEDLRPGDLVMTHDEGPQPLRWIGQRQVSAEGGFAPIRIRAGTFGNHRTLMVSPQHRILVRDSLAELLFGEDEVLVAAKDLVNDRTITVRRGGMVTYVHLLFDRHQVVYSDGLASESFLPGPQTTQSFDQDVVDEIHGFFPEINPSTGAGYSSAARRTLKGFEAQVLFASAKAA